MEKHWEILVVTTPVLLKNYLTTRSQTESLCKPLEIEDYVPQAVEFASPPKWHLAHVS